MTQQSRNIAGPKGLCLRQSTTLLTMLFFKGTILSAFSRGISATVHIFIKSSINSSLKSFDLVTAVNVC